MASQEGISKLRPEPSAVDYPKGTEMELLSINGDHTKLYVLSSHRFSESQAFRSGHLSVRLMKLVKEPVCMATCMLADHQWMLSKDSLVLRLTLRTFLFSQPGFLYGLSLPPSCTDKEANNLHDILTGLGCNTTTVENGMSGAKRERTAGMERMVERAVRTSAVVKLVTKALLAGTLDPDKHLELVVHREGTRSICCPGCYHLSMSTMKDLHSAMGAGGKELMIHHEAVEGCWRFNQHGLEMLLKIMSLYAPVAVSRVGGNNYNSGKKPKLDVIVEENGVEDAVKSSSSSSSSSCCGGGASAKQR